LKKSSITAKWFLLNGRQRTEAELPARPDNQGHGILEKFRQLGPREAILEQLLPEIERQQKRGKDVVVRADAASAKPNLYEPLEARGRRYAIRIPSNDTLEQIVAELLRRPVGQPTTGPWFGTGASGIKRLAGRRRGRSGQGGVSTVRSGSCGRASS
jgi:hypothetical protein